MLSAIQSTTTFPTPAFEEMKAGALMKQIKQADDATLDNLGCRAGTRWACEVKKFDFTYTCNEIAHIIKGEFTVTPHDGSEAMRFTAGDIAFFPKGMACTWDVRTPVLKRYRLDAESQSLAHLIDTERSTVEAKATTGVKHIKQADEQTIAQLGCASWTKWQCEPQTFDTMYGNDEVTIIREGDIIVTPKDGSEKMHVQGGDIVFFPRDFQCNWEVRKAVRKQYRLCVHL